MISAAATDAGWARPTGPRTLAARAAAAERVRAGWAARPPRRVILLVPDPHARFAAVEIDGEVFTDSVLASGYGACTYLFAWTVERGVAAAPELARYFGTFSDLLLRPDPATAIPVPGSGDSWYLVCDAIWPDGSPVNVAPRTFLRSQLAAAEGWGIIPSVGLEHEVTFYRSDGAPMTAHGIDYALGGTEPLLPLLSELREVLGEGGLGPESARAETHPGQYELVLRHRDALAACDDAMIQQFLVRQTAVRHGITASYLASEASGQGSSCHAHLSLNSADGSNLGARQAGSRELSPLLGSFLAGVLRAAADLTPVWAPTVNAYVRLRTGSFAPTEVRWGVDDRTAAVRLAGAGSSLRLECRFPGADAQPHLAVGALIAAGLSGIEDELRPPPSGQALERLAVTPWQALDRFTSSELVARLLGSEIVEHYAALFRAELDASADAVTDWQRRRGALRS
ncbi:glutamine synthetase family protein [Nocardia inohanensis]|uniref:glutamine synthetase family protein n=1 Tax=Nocardia inohanensis TaxID=209246 RepID=UPI000A89326A|nr:glutamine synthetase family protein [Nocardia inohanensis]